MTIKSFDGAEIFVREWADVEEPKAVVQIVHGMAEHCGRYEAFAKFLNEHGYIVVADDHRGHGNTDRDTLGYRDGDMFFDVVRDEAAITDYFKEKYKGLKYFLFGFSFGSFITQSYLGSYGDKLDAAVIAGSAYKKDIEVYSGTVVAGLGCALGMAKKPAKFIEKLSFGAYAKKFEDGQWLSTDAENNQAYAGDPLCGFTCSFRFYKDFFKGLRSLYTKKYAEGLKKGLPVLLVSGAQDPVGNMGKNVEKLHRYYTQKAGMQNVKLKLFENSRHEFLNEKEDRDEKWSAVLNFFQKNC